MAKIVTCKYCRGNGVITEIIEKLKKNVRDKCPVCGGIGQIKISSEAVTCKTCRGSGRIINRSKCDVCHGTGFAVPILKNYTQQTIRR